MKRIDDDEIRRGLEDELDRYKPLVVERPRRSQRSSGQYQNTSYENRRRSQGASGQRRTSSGQYYSSSGQRRSSSGQQRRASSGQQSRTSSGNRRRTQEYSDRYYETSGRQRRSSSASDRRRKKEKKRGIGLFGTLIILILLIALLVFGFLVMKMQKIQHRGVGNVPTYHSAGDYTEIALFGLDSRDGSLAEGNRTDTIMIACINNKTKEIKLVSVFRDTYLQMQDGTYEKANAAYSYGGPAEALEMLNKNLDLDITEYMTINFAALVDAVDILGGLDIPMTEEERVWMNGYVAETTEVTGVFSPTIDEPSQDGMYHLNGIQATSFCRIRYTEGGDFKRTERQRLVLQGVMDKAKHADLMTLNRLADKILPEMMTNMSSVRLARLGIWLKRYNITQQTGFPFDNVPMTIWSAAVVVPANLETNVTRLHQEVLEEAGYSVSSLVKQISDEIIWVSGVH